MFKKFNFKRTMVAIAICLAGSAAGSVLMTGCDDGIEPFMQSLGKGIDDYVACSTLRVTLVNNGNQAAHLYMEWEEAGPGNKVEPGESRLARKKFPTSSRPATVVAHGYRNNLVFSTRTITPDWSDDWVDGLQNTVTRVTVNF
jgi:hypothetical protein